MLGIRANDGPDRQSARIRRPDLKANVNDGEEGDAYFPMEGDAIASGIRVHRTTKMSFNDRPCITIIAFDGAADVSTPERAKTTHYLQRDHPKATHSPREVYTEYTKWSPEFFCTPVHPMGCRKRHPELDRGYR